jgi:hypothetical protein
MVCFLLKKKAFLVKTDQKISYEGFFFLTISKITKDW